MGARFEHHDPPTDEREIRSLSDRSGVELGQVRTLFRQEFTRLGMGAKVGSYLVVLTTANVRAMLGRTVQRAEAAQAALVGSAPRALCEALSVLREDDGGSVRAR